MRKKSSRPLGLTRLAAILFATLWLYGLLRARVAFARDSRRRLAIAAAAGHRWGRWVRALAGLRVSFEGPLPPPGSCLAPNHQGYLDVVVLQSLLPCLFVPKAEIAGWPVVGSMLRAGGHVYIQRSRSRALVEAARQMEERLAARQTVCIFLEGTSTGGDRVLPFHPSLLQPAIAVGAPVVPVSIVYSAADPTIDIAEEVAYWSDEHTIGPHALHVLGMRGVSAHVKFAAPRPAAGADRRALAADLHQDVLGLMGPAITFHSPNTPAIADR